MHSWKQVSQLLEWLVLKNSCADSIHQWVADSTQLKSARSAIKMSDSESQGQEEAACVCIFRPK